MANLKIGSREALDKNGFIQNYPVGTIVIRADSTIDDGWLLCDGRPISKNDYPELYSHLLPVSKIVASDLAPLDNFGFSIALSSDGITLAVGSVFEDSSIYSGNGAVYVYTLSSGVWTQQAKLLASDIASGDQFGNSVRLSSNGNTLIIGANRNTVTQTQQGAAYIFTRSGATWTQEARLVASDATTSDSFGSSVDISEDGNTAMVGSPSSTVLSGRRGAAYVFTRSGVTWTQQQKIVASDSAVNDLFGGVVDMSLDGTTAIISASTKASTVPAYGFAGAAYIFINSGGTWTQQAKLLASDITANDRFGSSISISSNGNIVAIGNNPLGSNTRDEGAVYTFTRSGVTWTQQQKIIPLDSTRPLFFGNSVSISSDGNTLAIGSRNTNAYISNGAAYIFTLSGGTWTQQEKIILFESNMGDGYGGPVFLLPGASSLVVSAYTKSPEGSASNNRSQGAAYFYNLDSPVSYGETSTTFNLPPLVYNATNNPEQRIPFSTISAEATYPNVFTHNHTVGINATSFGSYNHDHNHNSNTSVSRSDTMSHNHGSISGNTASSNNPVNPNAANLFSPGRLAGPAGPYASANTSATLNHVHAGGAWSSATQNSAIGHTHNVNIHTQTNYSHSHNTNMANLSHSVNSSSSYPLSKQVYFLIKT